MKKKQLNLAGVTPEVWARTIWFFIGLVSQFCIIFHLAPLPSQIADISIETLTVYITHLIAVAGEIRAWWKNNSFSLSAQDGDAVMKALESGELDYTPKPDPETDHEHKEVG